MTAFPIGILGTGSLASALVTGLCAGGDPRDAPEVIVSPRGAGTAERLAGQFPTVRVAADNQEVLDATSTVLVCLRQSDTGVLSELRWREDQTVVSASAGLGERALREAVSPASQVARAVPMVAVASRSWATPLRPAVPDAVAVFERTGGVLAVGSDEEFDAIYTGLGTVAPFFDYLATIEGFLTDHGLGEQNARQLVAQSFAHVLAPLSQSSAPDFAALVREHAPPGGGNDQLATLLRNAGVPGHTRSALDEVFRRQTGGRWDSV